MSLFYVNGIKRFPFFLMILCFFAFNNSVIAQEIWKPLVEDQQDFQQKAMMVLGGWGVVNAISGGIGMATTNGQAKHFHQMNLGWGLINTGIAVAGYLGARDFGLEDPLGMNLLNKNLSMSKAFLFNAGLDVGYVMGGLYLRERAKNDVNMPERLRGFGNSVMVQGAFLFTFDLIAYFLNTRHTHQIQDVMLKLGSSENGLGLILQF